MKETVEWICFVIGGILILSAVLTHIFKINLGGASVEGQSNLGQKIVAFVAGWIFVLIGGAFHGVGMYLAYDSRSIQPSAQTNAQPSPLPFQDTGNDAPGRVSSPDAPSTPRSRESVEISGDWRSSDSFTYRITQTRNAIKVDCMNVYGQVVGDGTGSIDGRTVKLTVTFYLNGARAQGSCRLQVSPEADGMSGTCQVGMASTMESWEKIE